MELVEQLKEAAKSKGLTVTEALDQAIEQYLENQNWSDEVWLPIAEELACAEMGVTELSEIGDDKYAHKIVQQCLARIRGKSHAETQKMISDALGHQKIIEEMEGKKPAKKKSARKRA